MKNTLAVDFLPFLDQDREINKLANNLWDVFTLGVGEPSPAPSLADTLDLFQRKEDHWLATSMGTNISNGRYTPSFSPERRPMVQKMRTERAPIQLRRTIHPYSDKTLNRGHVTGLILIERLEPDELVEEEFESIEAQFKQYDAKVETYNTGKPCIFNSCHSRFTLLILILLERTHIHHDHHAKGQ